jgi:hypothetical protein
VHTEGERRNVGPDAALVATDVPQNGRYASGNPRLRPAAGCVTTSSTRCRRAHSRTAPRVVDAFGRAVRADRGVPARVTTMARAGELHPEYVFPYVVCSGAFAERAFPRAVGVVACQVAVGAATTADARARGTRPKRARVPSR